MAVWAALVATAVVSAPVPRRHVFSECSSVYDPIAAYCPFFVAPRSGPFYCCNSLTDEMSESAPFPGSDCVAVSKYINRCPTLITTDNGAMCCFDNLAGLVDTDDYRSLGQSETDEYDAYFIERDIYNGYPRTGWE